MSDIVENGGSEDAENGGKIEVDEVSAELLQSLKIYLAKSCPILLGGAEDLFLESLDSKATEGCLKKFCGDNQIPALFACHNKPDSEDSKLDSPFSFSLDSNDISSKSSVISFVKASGVTTIDTNRSLQSQIFVCQVNGVSPFDSMLSYVRNCFIPYSRTLIKSSSSTKDARYTGLVRTVTGKLGELELELLKSQDSVEIPQVSLEVNPKIMAVISTASATNAKPRIEDLGDLQSDVSFLNTIQKELGGWKKSISGVTSLERDVSSGTSMQEINFWLGMERSLQGIEQQLSSVAVEFTFELLKRNRRFLATVGFQSDSGLPSAKEKVQMFTELYRDFPIQKLLATTTLREMPQCVKDIYSFLNSSLKRLKYSKELIEILLQRNLEFVHTVSEDLAAQIRTVLSSQKIMELNYDDFKETINGHDKLFKLWRKEYDRFHDEIREQKKLNSLSIQISSKQHYRLNMMEQRLTEIETIRKQHSELRTIIQQTFENDKLTQEQAIVDIDAAYENLKTVDCLSISTSGTEVWKHTLKTYDNRIDRVEGELEAKIRELLSAARDDANEMFRVCAKFNALFVRPRIQQAIREYQDQLIATVKKGINVLQEKFKIQYPHSQAKRMSAIRDLPPVSGAIIWARQIERQLNLYMQRVEDVLGQKWYHHVEGKRLKEETDQFKARLQPSSVFKEWLSDVEQMKEFDIDGTIFTVHSSANQPPRLLVNFDQDIITLFKEVRNLTHLGLRIPYEIKIASSEARAKYPSAVRLQEAVKIYIRTCARLHNDPALELLTSGYKKAVQDCIMTGINYRWHFNERRMKEYVTEFAQATTDFEDKVEELIEKIEGIGGSLENLKTCPPSVTGFREILSSTQEVVTDIDNRAYANVYDWVVLLSDRIERTLIKRLEEMIELWMQAVDGQQDTVQKQRRASLVELERKRAVSRDHKEDEKYNITADMQQHAGYDESLVVPEPSYHNILIYHQVLQVDPPLQHARLALIDHLHQWLAIVCDLPQLTCFNLPPDSEKTFRNVLNKINPKLLSSCFQKLEDKLNAAKEYVSEWLQYQALWDMDITGVYADLGDRVNSWRKLLNDMKRSRTTFDSTTSETRFGPVVINYSNVQQKVNDKYDSFHRDILTRFGAKLQGQLTELFAKLSDSRKKLEETSFELGTTSEIVSSVGLLQELNRKAEGWKKLLDEFKIGEKTLHGNRYLFPSDWRYHDQVFGEFNALQQILQRRIEQLNQEGPAIQAQLNTEGRALAQRVKEFIDDWKENRPISGIGDYAEVQDRLNVYEGKLTQIEEEVERLQKAKRALEMPVEEETRLGYVREELEGIKEVAKSLGAIWEKVIPLKETKFVDCKPIEVRKALQALIETLKEFPNRMRQYESYEHTLNSLKSYLKHNSLIHDLSSGTLRPKHQKQILQIMKLDGTILWQKLTVGHIWNIDLKVNKESINYILETAQGEAALEEFLREMRESWDRTLFEMVDYRQKCFLIRNWDDLMSQVADQLGQVMSMKQSPYYKTFEREALGWEDKLQKSTAIFDVFIDIQRRWVYLEGVFTNSADVQQQLAYQYRKFKTFDREFVKLMRGIRQDSQIDTWVADEKDLFSRLESDASVLNAIQKALGDYLETQRAAFPRFYFVGDEDLLEIIGNAKDPRQIIKHLAKMFAGITSLILNPDNPNEIWGIVSREGEEVRFREIIDIIDNPAIQAWLTKVEYQMRFTLASMLEEAVKADVSGKDGDAFFEWVDRFPAQVVLLASQVAWSTKVDENLKAMDTGEEKNLQEQLNDCVTTLTVLAEGVLLELPPDKRKKYEQLITELVHQRDVIRTLIKKKICNDKDFEWLYQLRFYWNPNNQDLMKKLEIKISRASFYYGFEYLGVAEKLVQTPLTDSCYLTLTEALHSRMGGNPFGPAGTGKTESVKALGATLGRFVLVFNCDETFDFMAMGRIFVGLCQCGAWGCFDEFNRLEERILSAVSQQILTIQTGLIEDAREIHLIGKKVLLDSAVGIFVTMNPGYAGRSELPDNLKQLFRGVAMMKPNRQLIAQVMLYSQGFTTAEKLSGKIVLLFSLCKDQLSSQSHYDFGLRALKSVLRSAGRLKREYQGEREERREQKEEVEDVSQEQFLQVEQDLLLKSLQGTVIPKLVTQDIVLFRSLMFDVFPSAKNPNIHNAKLYEKLTDLCQKSYYRMDDCWIEKIWQLNTILDICHGVMLVGPSGTGKTAAWKTLQKAMELTDGIKSENYIINPKALTKDDLYGKLDPTTLEWTDGIFTHTLRKIIDNVRGEAGRRHWILFDGDVDPEWAENLNSVLDDNRILTLPNGERLMLTDNIRIIFEAKNLQYATLATVSRCGMVWFSHECLTNEMIYFNMLNTLKSKPIQSGQVAGGVIKGWEIVQEAAVGAVEQYFVEDGLVNECYKWGRQQKHVMSLSRIRAFETLFSLLKGGIVNILEYNDLHQDFPLRDDQIGAYMSKYLVFSLLWSVCGSTDLKLRILFGKAAHGIVAGAIDLPPESDNLIDFEVVIASQDWALWNERVSPVDIESHQVVRPNFVVDTIDTVRHEEILRAWLHDRRCVILCGPPGSGKSMTLTAVLNANPQYELVTLNFSSTTGTDLIFKTFDHYCKYVRSPTGYKLQPVMKGKWLVLFCDEINLPCDDLYGTQTVITFMRQIIEQGGFWRPEDHAWITLERIQFVGACNPPTDPGRVDMTGRFLRHCPVILVDFPAPESLRQIYGTFNRGLMKLVPTLRSYFEPLTEAMIDVYTKSQNRFTPDQHPHYIYSPRELSRWVRGMYGAMNQQDGMDVDQLARLWLHEGLRLFQDRLVTKPERIWTDELMDETLSRHFPDADKDAFTRPVFFSDWLSKEYVSVEKDALREHVLQRLRVFQEEELDVKLVIFDEVLEHILRIDRVLRQPLGHLLLVGASGAGKTVLSRFVAWMNGMSVFQIKVHKGYTAMDFDDDLREVLIRSGCKDEKICFIFDESNVLDSAFLERMNALLASGEVPGLFEDAEYTALIQECRESARRDAVMIDDEEELFQRFSKLVQQNLHIVFTMNPANPDFENRSATSPALFNRCVVDWFGEWSDQALSQVGAEFTTNVDLAIGIEEDSKRDEESLTRQRNSVVSSLVFVHKSVHGMMQAQARRIGRSSYVTPRHYLDLIKHFVALFGEKREELEDQQRHLNTGLKKLKETEEEVNVRQAALNVKKQELQTMDQQANEKLEQIMVDEKKATEKREQSLKIQKEIDIQQAAINERAVVVQGELAEAGPMLEAAQKAVQGVRKQDLTEIANLLNPPALVKLALGAVFTILGQAKHANDWKMCRKLVRKSDFIKSVLSFDTEGITASTRNKVFGDYIEQKQWDEAKINRASKACGPLAKWVFSQANYAKILQSVEPLRNEVKELSGKAVKLQQEQSEITEMIKGLEQSIVSYKQEYKVLIAQSEKIRIEMENVKSKVDRSINLLRNLSSERERWDSQSQNFRQQLTTIVGDCLLSAAFITYVGWFDHTYRGFLLERWRDHLSDVEVVFQDNLVMSEYLSRPSKRLQWKSSALPDDELCVENAVMLERFNRYPLVIDPSGQATQFIMNEFKERKITRTSFLDDSFLKSLESALRFGNALLVDDVESIDPVLNSVLNREIQRVGGRVLIRVGDKDIDFSPKFVIFLCTRDPTCHFTPDLCSRVTFVNFSVTPSSLRSQCLSQILLAEQPEVDKKRTDLLRIQGEFRVRLRTLEDQLLDALNEVKGNILDDDTIMSTLETLKKEAADINKKMARTETVMEEVSQVSSMYTPFALSCSRIYFSMEQLGIVHFLYQFSLTFFLQIIDDVLRSTDDEELKSQESTEARLDILTFRLYESVFARVSRGLLQRDHIAFALRLAQIRLESSPEPLDKLEIDFLVRGKVNANASLDNSVPVSHFGFSGSQINALTQLLALEEIKPLERHLANNPDEWKSFIDAKTDELPDSWQNTMSELQGQFQRILVQKVFRPDRVVTSSQIFVSEVFKQEFLSAGADADLSMLVKDQIDCNSPLLLVGTPGNDPSGKVEALGATAKSFQSFAMGSPDGYDKADSAVSSAAKKGTWILLKNVHLSPSWLVSLEKKLHRLDPNKNFRLFLTMEINPKVPATLLRKSYVMIFEPPAGIKSSLQRSYNSIPSARIDRAPAERSRLYILLAWLHAVVLERLRYTPVGWSKGFEFSETDQQCAMDAIDEWVDRLGEERSHIDPQTIPWHALQVMLEQYVYGGRIDNQFDNERLSGFVRHLFSPESFNADFSLTKTFANQKSSYSPKLPDNTNYLSVKKWISGLDDVAILSPTLLGLPSNAERMLLTRHAIEMCGNLLYLQEVEEEDDAGESKEHAITDSDDPQSTPSWMVEILDSLEKWGESLPATDGLTSLPRGPESVKNPLFRSLSREVTIGKKVLYLIKSTTETLRLVVDGKEKVTNELRLLLKSLRDEMIPKSWSLNYSVPSMSVSLWVADFAKRVKQLQFFCDSKYVEEPIDHIWLGGLFSPAAFVSATRQSVAQRNGWPLEQLVLEVHVGRSDDHQTMNTFVFDDLRMNGAIWDHERQCLQLSDESAINLPPTHFEWKLSAESNQTKIADSSIQFIDIPVYLNSGLQDLLFSVKLPCPADIPQTTWSQRGTCFTVWAN